MLTFEQIKELVELVAARRLQGLEVERSGFRLRIDGYGAVETSGSAASPAGAPPAPAASPSSLPVPEAASAPAAAAPPPEPSAHVLNSPIVGTFYRAASPEAPPFVDVGSRVKKGQVLCIIEAMKLMNEIEADADGVIAEIYPQNAQPVEFGEPLFAIRIG